MKKDSNLIGDEGCQAFADSLMQNKTLEKLYLRILVLWKL